MSAAAKAADPQRVQSRRFAAVPLAAASSELPGRALRVLIAICASADQGGSAWPGITELARRTGLKRNHVPAEVKRLERAGLIRVERARGRGSVYGINYAPELSPQMVTPPVTVHGDTSAAGLSPQTVTTVTVDGAKLSPSTGTKQTIEQTNEEREKHTPSLSLGERVAGKPVLRVVSEGEPMPEEMAEPIAEPIEPETPSPSKAAKRSKAHPAEIDAGFAEFWQAYPRHDDRKPALKAYVAALKVASAGEILMGARAYAEARRGEDTKFTKLAKTWLRAEAWNNPALTKATPKFKNPFANMLTGAAAALDELRQGRDGCSGFFDDGSGHEIQRPAPAHDGPELDLEVEPATTEGRAA